MVTRDGKKVAVLRPEKRFYPVAQDNDRSSDARNALQRSLHCAREPVGEKAWAVRVNVKHLFAGFGLAVCLLHLVRLSLLLMGAIAL